MSVNVICKSLHMKEVNMLIFILHQTNFERKAKFETGWLKQADILGSKSKSIFLYLVWMERFCFQLTVPHEKKKHDGSAINKNKIPSIQPSFFYFKPLEQAPAYELEQNFEVIITAFSKLFTCTVGQKLTWHRALVKKKIQLDGINVP